MPLPFILAGAAIAAVGYGAKKGYDGRQDSTSADEIFKLAEAENERMTLDLKKEQQIVDKNLTSLGEFQLEIAQNFSEFKRMSDEILSSLGKDNLEKNISINVPEKQLDKIKQVEISATSFLASMAGGAATGGVASFAVYSGVMAFAAASTGTPIAALSGAAAYNATMAAIGGGSIAAGGFGMAGGTLILGSVAAAPIVAVMGHFYAAKAAEKLEKARAARGEVRKASEKVHKYIIPYLKDTNIYVNKIYNALKELYNEFIKKYFDIIKAVHSNLDNMDELFIKEDKLMNLIGNGLYLCAVMADIITTPLFKVKKLENGSIEIMRDKQDLQILNKSGIDTAIVQVRLS